MRKLAATVWGIGLVAVALQAAALATQYFQPSLNADYLYPQRFAAGLLSGTYPLSGAVHTPAPYFFPDLAVSTLLVAITANAPSLPYYVIASFVALAMISGWALRRAGCAGAKGWLAGVALVNGLLLCRGLADHQLYLWWLGIAGFHGGTLLAGLAQFALWTGPTDRRPTRGRIVLSAALMIPGLASDTLLLTQMVGPLWLAMAFDARRGWSCSPRVRSLAGVIGLAIAAVVLFRLGCAVTGFGTFGHLARYAPLPAAMLDAAGQFGHDIAKVFWPQAAVFVMVGMAGTAGVFALAIRAVREREALSAERRQAIEWTAISLVATVTLPIVTVYWKSAFNARYLLPFLVLPVWGMMAGLLPAKRFDAGWRESWARFLPFAALGIFFGIVAMQAGRSVRTDAWRWPYPERVAELDRVLAANHVTRGLSDYWHAHLLTTLSHTGMRLNQLRPDGRVYFWNNNAFTHYDVDAGGRLRTPEYRFIVVDGLDPAALVRKFGEPSRRAPVAGLTLWFYDSAAARRLSAMVDAEVRAFLKNRPGTERIEPFASAD